jgi:hypothetical protein
MVPVRTIASMCLSGRSARYRETTHRAQPQPSTEVAVGGPLSIATEGSVHWPWLVLWMLCGEKRRGNNGPESSNGRLSLLFFLATRGRTPWARARRRPARAVSTSTTSLQSVWCYMLAGRTMLRWRSKRAGLPRAFGLQAHSAEQEVFILGECAMLHRPVCCPWGLAPGC